MRLPIYAKPSIQRETSGIIKIGIHGETRFIEKGGWDKMPGQKEALSDVAQECAFGLEGFIKNEALRRQLCFSANL